MGFEHPRAFFDLTYLALQAGQDKHPHAVMPVSLKEVGKAYSVLLPFDPLHQFLIHVRTLTQLPSDLQRTKTGKCYTAELLGDWMHRQPKEALNLKLWFDGHIPGLDPQMTQQLLIDALSHPALGPMLTLRVLQERYTPDAFATPVLTKLYHNMCIVLTQPALASGIFGAANLKSYSHHFTKDTQEQIKKFLGHRVPWQGGTDETKWLRHNGLSEHPLGQILQTLLSAGRIKNIQTKIELQQETQEETVQTPEAPVRKKRL